MYFKYYFTIWEGSGYTLQRVRRDTITISSSDGEHFYYVAEDTEDAGLQTKIWRESKTLKLVDW